jgi:uncharacterized cupredoxin-like copper-binding protein
MAPVPVLAIALLLASASLLGFVYLKPKRAAPEAVLHVDRVAQAVASTSSAKSFTFTYAASITAAGKTLSMSGSGSYDVEHKLVEMKMRFDGASAAGANAELVLDNSHGLVEYMNMALLQSRLPAGKSWVKLDVGALAKKAGIDLSKLQQGDSADPSKMFSYLRRAAVPTVVGHETVGGVSTTHYKLTIDLRRLAAAETDATARESRQRAIQLSGVSSYPAEAWVGSDGYLRRMRITVPQSQDATQPVATMTMTEELADFGTDVRIAVPPASSVVDIAKLGRG